MNRLFSPKNLPIHQRHSTARIVTYILMILVSIWLLILILTSSGSTNPRFLVSTIGIWLLFVLFCVYKIYRAGKYKGVFRKGSISVTELDNIDGIAFEELTCDILLANGFDHAESTPASSDYGVDVIAVKEGITYAIQCKRYLEPVGIDAIQQVYAGRDFYDCHVAVVLTNQTFTQNAERLADKIGVILWDREALRDLL